MKWEQFLEQHGENVEGMNVWIVDARRSDGKAFLRHVPPTLVEVTNNSELPENKRIYYSHYHFRKYGKNGKLTKQIIAPFDNTGHGLNTGGSVHVFDSYNEAVAKYNEQLEVVKYSYAADIEELMRDIENIESMKLS